MDVGAQWNRLWLLLESAAWADLQGFLLGDGYLA